VSARGPPNLRRWVGLSVKKAGKLESFELALKTVSARLLVCLYVKYIYCCDVVKFFNVLAHDYRMAIITKLFQLCIVRRTSVTLPLLVALTARPLLHFLIQCSHTTTTEVVMIYALFAARISC